MRGKDHLLVEARRHSEAQLVAYRDIDQKALDIMRFNMILVTLIVAGIGLYLQVDRRVRISAWETAIGGLGITFVAASLVLALFAYFSKFVDLGLENTAEAYSEEGISASEVVAFILEAYEIMIAHDRQAVEVKTNFVSLSLLSLIGGVLGCVTFAVSLIGRAVIF